MKRWAKRVLCEVLAGLLLLSFVCPAWALADAERTRVVRVSCGINSALYLNAAGVPTGFCSHYLRRLA